MNPAAISMKVVRLYNYRDEYYRPLTASMAISMSSDLLENISNTYVRQRFIKTGVVLLVIGFGLQIVGQMLQLTL